MDYCGRCRSCRAGDSNLCLDKRADMGFTADGGYGPYELVHETNFFPVPDDIGLTEATMLLDLMGTSGHAIARARLVRPDIESVYVAGAGPIGLGILVMCVLTLGTEVPVRISDVSPWRLEFARTFGAEAVDARDLDALSGLPRPTWHSTRPAGSRPGRPHWRRSAAVACSSAQGTGRRFTCR